MRNASCMLYLTAIIFIAVHAAGRCRYGARWSVYIRNSPCLYSTRDHAGTVRVSTVSTPGTQRLTPVFTLTPVAPSGKGCFSNRIGHRDSHGAPILLRAPFWFFHSVRTSICAARKAKFHAVLN